MGEENMSDTGLITKITNFLFNQKPPSTSLRMSPSAPNQQSFANILFNQNKDEIFVSGGNIQFEVGEKYYGASASNNFARSIINHLV